MLKSTRYASCSPPFPIPTPRTSSLPPTARASFCAAAASPSRSRAEAGSRKGLFQRKTFWDVLMNVIAAAVPEYAGYSYRDRADRYQREFSRAELDELRAARDLVRYSTLRDQLRAVAFSQAEIFAKR